MAYFSLISNVVRLPPIYLCNSLIFPKKLFIRDSSLFITHKEISVDALHLYMYIKLHKSYNNSGHYPSFFYLKHDISET
jgi:hypothetical protein